MKNKNIFTLKMNSPDVFNSHWFIFTDMKPLLFLTGSMDQSDMNDPTVFWNDQFWLDDSFRPRGKGIQGMSTTKINLRVNERPLHRSPDVISNVACSNSNFRRTRPVTQIIRREQQVLAGSPRTHHSRLKRRRNLNCRPPPRDRSYGPIPHPVTPKQYKPFTGSRPAPKPNTRDSSTEILLHNKLLPKAGTFTTRGDDKKQKYIDAGSLTE